MGRRFKKFDNDWKDSIPGITFCFPKVNIRGSGMTLPPNKLRFLKKGHTFPRKPQKKSH